MTASLIAILIGNPTIAPNSIILASAAFKYQGLWHRFNHRFDKFHHVLWIEPAFSEHPISFCFSLFLFLSLFLCFFNCLQLFFVQLFWCSGLLNRFYLFFNRAGASFSFRNLNLFLWFRFDFFLWLCFILLWLCFSILLWFRFILLRSALTSFFRSALASSSGLVFTSFFGSL